jgi:hypothetical protein
VVAVIVAVAVEPERAHPDALPPVAIANVVAPVPKPPVVDIDKACEYGKALVLAVRDVMLNVA